MSADQVRRALAEVCGYHDGSDCQHCADTYAHAQLHKGMSDDEILADIQLYRSDFGTWEAKVRAAGRRQAADAILDAFDAMKGRIKTKTTDKKVAACQMVGLSMAALKVIEMADGWGAPAEPVEGADRG